MSGDGPSVALWERGSENKVLHYERLHKTQEWSQYERVFTTSSEAKSVSIYLYTPSDGKQSNNLFDAVTMLEQPKVDNFLVAADRASMTPDLRVSNFSRISPTKFSVEVVGSKGLVVLNESYHKGWTASITEHGGMTSELKLHIPVNGFANGWMVDTDGTRSKITIEFTPQRWFNVGLVISGTTLAACIGYLTYDFIHSRRKRNYHHKGK